MNEFAEGLGLERLHPANIIVFLQGLSRRVDARLVAQAVDAEDPTNPMPDAKPALRVMLDHLTLATVKLKEAGYAPDHDIQDHAQPAVAADPELTRLNAAAIEFARRVGGVPDAVWMQQPELLEMVRNTCAHVAEQLPLIGDTTEVQVDDIAD